MNTKISHLKSYIFIIIISLVLFIPTCSSDETLKEETRRSDSKSEENDHLVLAIDEWTPFTSSTLDGYGVCSEIVTAALESEGMNHKFIFRPWSRTLEMIKHTDAWGTYPWFKTEEREKDYLFSQSIISIQSKLFYKKDNQKLKPFPEYKVLNDLKDFTFGGVHGYYYEGVFKKENFEYRLATDLHSAYEMLNDSKVDLIIESEAVGWHILKELYPDNLGDFSTIDSPDEQSEMYLMISKDYPNGAELLDKFNKGLRTIKENGTYDALLDKYNISH